MKSDDRQRLWIAVYALSAFDKAEASCRLLLERCDDNKHPLFSALSTAVHIFYSRPFRCTRGIERIHLFQDSDVPAQFRGMHEFLVSFRDKLVAHTDADTEKDFGIEMHDVQVRRLPDDCIFSWSDPAVIKEAYQDVLPVFDSMKRVAAQRLVDCKMQNEAAFPSELGDYLLKLRGDIAFVKE